MAGNQQMMPPQYMAGQQMMPTAFVEQPQFAAAAAPYFATHESEVEESDEEAESADESEEADTESDSEEETESDEAEDSEARFMEQTGPSKKEKKAAKKAGKGTKSGKKTHKLSSKKHGKKHGKKSAHGKAGKKVFKPKMGKPQNNKRSPSAKTPKAAGGRALPPMPAPLAPVFKIDCKKNPQHCIDAETPAEGEEPGDHSPKAVFKKKMEVIKRSLMVNNRNIAAESKWIDQVELIMKQYALKVRKVKEHIGDERKAIKELLRQRRIILNEKKQKELELRLKMATTELTSLTDALTQVKKKEKELGAGKGQLGAKISTLVGDLKKLRTDKAADEKQALKKAD